MFFFKQIVLFQSFGTICSVPQTELDVRLWNKINCVYEIVMIAEDTWNDTVRIPIQYWQNSYSLNQFVKKEEIVFEVIFYHDEFEMSVSLGLKPFQNRYSKVTVQHNSNNIKTFSTQLFCRLHFPRSIWIQSITNQAFGSTLTLKNSLHRN